MNNAYFINISPSNISEKIPNSTGPKLHKPLVKVINPVPLKSIESP